MSTMSGAATAMTVGATKRAGIFCGWLTALLIGAGCAYVGMTAFASRVAPALHVYSYPEGRCTIQFIRPLSPWRRSITIPGNPATPRYIIVFSFTVHTSGNQDYQIVGTGMGSEVVSSSAELQSMVSNYHQGGVYPCWYNPSDPSHVVLYRSMPIFSFIWSSSFTALGLLVMLRALTRIVSNLSPSMLAVIRIPALFRRKSN
jgi:hypothetical protein